MLNEADIFSILRQYSRGLPALGARLLPRLRGPVAVRLEAEIQVRRQGPSRDVR